VFLTPPSATSTRPSAALTRLNMTSRCLSKASRALGGASKQKDSALFAPFVCSGLLFLPGQFPKEPFFIINHTIKIR
jgi:hypothetical protein